MSEKMKKSGAVRIMVEHVTGVMYPYFQYWAEMADGTWRKMRKSQNRRYPRAYFYQKPATSTKGWLGHWTYGKNPSKYSKEPTEIFKIEDMPTKGGA